MKPSRYFHRILSSLYGLNNQPGVAVGAAEVVEAEVVGVVEDLKADYLKLKLLSWMSLALKKMLFSEYII